jgi:hypothetical protein
VPAQLPAAEMRAAIDVQGVTRDRRGVVQLHDRIRDIVEGQNPSHWRQAFASSNLLWLDVNAATSQPYAAANYTAICPSHRC